MFHVLPGYFFVFFEEVSLRLFFYLLIRLLFMQLSFGSPSYIVGSVLQLDILLANPVSVLIYIYLLLTSFAVVKMLSGLM